MAKFSFEILNGNNPQAQYDSIITKNPLTFYLLSTGIGYLGSVKLFDATDGTIKNLVTDMLSDEFVADDVSAASTSAIVKYVTDKVKDISALLTVKFFRKVESHTITEAELSEGKISFPSGTKAGDVGLLFTADTDDKAGEESLYFISLTDYLQNVYTFESTNSIELTSDSNNKITATLKIKESEHSVKIDTEEGGLYLEKATTVNEKVPSSTKLITESSLVNYIKNIVIPMVEKSIAEATDDMVTVNVNSLNSEVSINGSTYTNLTEAVDNVETNGTITLISDTVSEGIQTKSNCDFVIDLSENSLLLDGQLAGSPGTQTNGFQFLKDSNITIKNGTIIAEDAYIVIQNYSNLTLDNVTIEGKKGNGYLLSNNYGNIVLKNNTKILAQEGTVAFDLYYGMFEEYDSGITVTIADNTVVIEGPIEYGKTARATEEDFLAKCKLITPRGYELDIPEGYEWTNSENDTQTLTKIATS
jgi:hypothetical protein